MRTKFLPAVIVLLQLSCATKKTLVTPNMEIKKAGGAALNDTFITGLLKQYPHYFDTVLKHNDVWRIQIIYTQINRTARNRPRFKNYYFNLNPSAYFYPASTVKMPTAVLALQRLNDLKIEGLNKNTTMITGAAYSRQDAVYNDPNSPDGRPTVANYVKKIFLVSDNDAFNRLYEFLGQEYINNQLHRMGYDSTQIIHRLDISRTEDENRHTNPVKFYDSSSKIIYQQPLVTSRMMYQPRQTFLGKAYYNGNQLINQPFEFSKKNRITLADLHSVLETILFPEALRKKQRFHLTGDDYQFLYRYMSMKPGESEFPQYDSSYNGAYSKLLMYGGKGDVDPNIRIFNKEGDAYGFLNDIAYVVDFKNGVDFFLSATISCNSDGIYNDDRYDYETVGYPFLKNLGQVIYQYELQRKKSMHPICQNLSLITRSSSGVGSFLYLKKFPVGNNCQLQTANCQL